MNLLPCVEIEPSTPAKASVIWLHGLGADGHDFEPVVPELRLPEPLAVRFIFPHAPEIPVTINGGFIMPAWYDILEMDIDRKVDEAQLLQSAAAVQALIDRELERGIESRHVVIAGFSQGGAVGYHAALTYPKPLAGLLALSTYFATVNSIEVHPANQQIPIQIFHGTNDPVVQEIHGQNSMKYLTAMGFEPRYQSFPMEHAICIEEIEAISLWLQKTLG
jgi:phospholipase/carboxylesterase|tara:strand:+ start:20000 stop:20659 length:660 start_codon:yes stop_codon:yes gene_type:complete